MAARIVRSLAACCIAACLAATPAGASEADVSAAASLRAMHAALRVQLGSNQFGRPLHLNSSESPDSVTGDIFALIDHPFAASAAALVSPGDWCEIMILHINTKYCRASSGTQGSVLNVSIGKKFDQPLDEAYRVVFSHQATASTADYLRVRLHAGQGPLGTRNYRIMLEAIPVAGGDTFVHLSYSYGQDMVGRLAMQAYLATTGRNKVGFTISGTQPDGQPVHIGGTRGVVERNTMRYYLAIEAFLGALAVPPHARLEKRLRDWFAAAERYPRQLHEMEQADYLQMKRREQLRQQSVQWQRDTLSRVIANLPGEDQRKR